MQTPQERARNAKKVQKKMQQKLSISDSEDEEWTPDMERRKAKGKSLSI